MNKDFSIQEYLSLGYIYLLILGILSDSIYYGFIGINILDYSGLLDVLVSPVALLTTHYLIPLAIVLFVGFAYFLTSYLNPRVHQKFRTNRWYRKVYNVDKLDTKYSTPPNMNMIILQIAGFILSIYLGMGLGRGIGLREDIKNNEIEIDHRLLFQDNTEERVKLVGKNSLYLFYISEGQTDIIISPIEYNVKKIINLKENK